MRAFTYARADDAATAVRTAARQDTPKGATLSTGSQTEFLAGGTNLIDYMKLDAMRPGAVVDINGLAAQHGRIELRRDGLHLGALVRMSQLGDDAGVKRDYPVIAETMTLAASAQLRNMASLGGNVLQRTRCSYFRDTSWTACNKRVPGSGCSAIGGVDRKHAVLGVSDKCISTYPGDFAQALVALDAMVEVLGAGGARSFKFEELHRSANEPHLETTLSPGELILGFFIPASPVAKRSTYVKVRDRESYEYAIASCAAALALGAGERVDDARIALGGVAYRPWRAREAEAFLKGKALTPETAAEAGRLAFASAVTHGENAFKPELGAATVARALLQAARMEA